jgi:hypothetical protein
MKIFTILNEAKKKKYVTQKWLEISGGQADYRLTKLPI